MAIDPFARVASSSTFPVHLPNHYRWAWNAGAPSSPLFSRVLDHAGPGRRPRLDWLLALLRLEVVKQRSNLVVMPDALLAAARFGPTPTFCLSESSRRLRRLLTLCTPAPVVYYRRRHPVTPFDLPKLTDPGQPFAVAADSPRRCPAACPMSRSWQPHGHFLLLLRDRFLGNLHRASNPRLLGKVGNDPARSAYRYHFDTPALDPGHGLYTFYAPLAVLGHLAGLTQSEVRLAVSLTSEVTRAARSKRADSAVVLDGGQGHLPPGRWVPCQGNGQASSKDNGVTYFLKTRLLRSRHVSGSGQLTRQAIKSYLADVSDLGLTLGVLFLVRTPDGQDRDACALLHILDSRPDLAPGSLLDLTTHAYLPHNYLTAWRDWLEMRTAFDLSGKDTAIVTIEEVEASEVRNWLAAPGRTIRGLAEAAGVSHGAVYDMIHGHRVTRRSTVSRILAVCHNRAHLPGPAAGVIDYTLDPSLDDDHPAAAPPAADPPGVGLALPDHSFGPPSEDNDLVDLL